MPECLLMAHMVAGYPSLEKSLDVAHALVSGGADYLEVQFPFSDPTADGPIIERACQVALEAGFKVDAGFELAERLTKELAIPIFIMTYGSLVFARGAEAFSKRAAEAGTRGLIVPDLPPDYDERLFEAGADAGLAVTPVVAPGISEERLRLIGGLKPEYVYTAIRHGVTGGRTSLDAATVRYLGRVSATGAKIVAGFGVRSRGQMLTLAEHVHAAAVGTYFLEALNEAGEDFAARLETAARILR